MTTSLFVGVDCAPTRELAAAIPAELVTAPELAASTSWEWSFADDVERFAASLAAGPAVDHAVVCTWAAGYEPLAPCDTDTSAWIDAVERPLALWYAVLGAVAERCVDGGAMAVVIERPAPVDSTDHAPASAVAEGLATVARSLALVHGERGVRVNAVTTAVGTAPETLLGMPPALRSYPGTPAREVAGAVRMVLSADACGVSGTTVHADGGRS